MLARVGITVCDVGPRDGLQNEPDTLAPAVRAELVDRLGAAGLPRIEAVSFVRGDRVPQMADAEEVVARVERRAGVELSGLVLNEKGWERFAACRARSRQRDVRGDGDVQRANGNATLAEAVARTEAILAAAGETPATVTISCAFGCPFEGPVDPGVVAELVAPFAGRAEVVLADTIGVATPSAVRSLVERHERGRLPRPQHAQHRLRELPRRSRRVRPSSTRRSAASAAARSRRARRATSRRRISSGSSNAKASRRASTLTRSSSVSQWLEGVLGRTLEGYVYRASPWPPRDVIPKHMCGAGLRPSR